MAAKLLCTKPANTIPLAGIDIDEASFRFVVDGISIKPPIKAPVDANYRFPYAVALAFAIAGASLVELMRSTP